ncbi:MAG: DUF169 domain-containing protein [Thermodesulfobacteriota bacterium]
MTEDRWAGLAGLLDVLGLDEGPLGIFFTDRKPAEGFTPQPLDLPTREKEMKGEINWGALFGGFSCTLGHIWRARRRRTAAWFSAENFGCPGGAFFFCFNKPQVEFIVHYVSSGIPGQIEGEFYLATPDECRAMYEYVDPRPAPAPYLVIKPLETFGPDETPELVAFFARPESLAGLHQLATFATGRPDVVRSPFSAGCGGLVAWPLYYLERGDEAAVLGGWDPSARKYYKTDELSFTAPLSLFQKMLQRWPESFLTRKTWGATRKKVERSRRAWGEAIDQEE